MTNKKCNSNSNSNSNQQQQQQQQQQQIPFGDDSKKSNSKLEMQCATTKAERRDGRDE
jgi:hypothetical protein